MSIKNKFSVRMDPHLMMNCIDNGHYSDISQQMWNEGIYVNGIDGILKFERFAYHSDESYDATVRMTKNIYVPDTLNLEEHHNRWFSDNPINLTISNGDTCELLGIAQIGIHRIPFNYMHIRGASFEDEIRHKELYDLIMTLRLAEGRKTFDHELSEEVPVYSLGATKIAPAIKMLLKYDFCNSEISTTPQILQERAREYCESKNYKFDGMTIHGLTNSILAMDNLRTGNKTIDDVLDSLDETDRLLFIRDMNSYKNEVTGSSLLPEK